MIGVGWVGLVTAACFAELGHPVIARDILPEKVESLARGETTIHEPGLDELLRRNTERLTFTTEMSELLGVARLLFVCVDTPPTASGDADLSPRALGRRGARCRRRPRPGDEEHRAGRHRQRDPPRPARPRLRLLPRVPQGGQRGRRLPAPRPGRDRRRPRRRGGGERWSPPSTSRSAARWSAPTSPAPR